MVSEIKILANQNEIVDNKHHNFTLTINKLLSDIEQNSTNKNNPDILMSLANNYRSVGDYLSATINYQKVINLLYANHPKLAIVYNQLGWVQRKLARLEDALLSFEKAININPDFYGARANRSLILLQKGDFINGWREYENRLQDAPELQAGEFFSRWRGLEFDNLKNKKILIFAEQGYGDQIQFLRYAPLLAKHGAEVDILIKPPLIRLAETLPNINYVYSATKEPVSYDYQIELMSLPFMCKSKIENIPAEIPYFFPKANDIVFWAKKLPKNQKLNIGLIWRGAFRANDFDAANMDKRRSISLDNFGFLKNYPNINIISLQTEENEVIIQELDLWHKKSLPKIFMFANEIHDFYDSACLVANLDLIISVDTAGAHLAGALGKPVWILNRYDQCWRWLINRQYSPWYPSAKLFQQNFEGDWASVLAKVEKSISELFI